MMNVNDRGPLPQERLQRHNERLTVWMRPLFPFNWTIAVTRVGLNGI